MAACAYTLALTSTPTRLSDVYGGAPGVILADQNLAFRQLLVQASGAAAVIGSAIAGGDTYPGVVLADGPTAYWRFEDANGSLNLADSSGNNHPAVFPAGNGALTYRVPGVLGDGSVGVGQLAGGVAPVTVISPGIVLGTTCTFEGWLKAYSGVQTFALMMGGNAGGTGLYYNEVTQKIDLNYSGADHFNTTALTVGAIYHSAVSIAAGNGTFYINGVANGTFAGWPGSTIAAILNTGGGGFTLGSSIIDEFAIYPTALSATRIAQHYTLRTAPLSQPLPVDGAPTQIGPFETGPMKLSDFYAVGAGSTLHILGIPF